ncbi:hypothetical protein SmJEL517_g06173 [Synchytrium microbalum]|uniref:Uncharacterized protein n=1 Tax=Synchytrium microbalum TaxID=1806994 RepID=A0A507BWK5_9FUNG|nr:uncharacterized protein SmJEL517_g06173 [Synchytrium microbalum]TPX30214.1 hypothetical protein SmJEL517_g06173 [Synchytrium microbalum]
MASSEIVRFLSNSSSNNAVQMMGATWKSNERPPATKQYKSSITMKSRNVDVATMNNSRSGIESTNKSTLNTNSQQQDVSLEFDTFDAITGWGENQNDEPVRRCLTAPSTVSYVSGDTPFPTPDISRNQPLKSGASRRTPSGKTRTLVLNNSTPKSSAKVKSTRVSNNVRMSGCTGEAEEEHNHRKWLMDGEDDSIEYLCDDREAWDIPGCVVAATPLSPQLDSKPLIYNDAATTITVASSARSSPKMMPPPLPASLMAAALDIIQESDKIVDTRAMERKAVLPHIESSPMLKIPQQQHHFQQHQPQLQSNPSRPNSPAHTRPKSSKSSLNMYMQPSKDLMVNTTASINTLPPPEAVLRPKSAKPVARAGTPSTPMDIISVRQKLRRSANKRSIGLAASKGNDSKPKSRPTSSTRKDHSKAVRSVLAPAADPVDGILIDSRPGSGRRGTVAADDYLSDDDNEPADRQCMRLRQAPWSATPTISGRSFTTTTTSTLEKQASATSNITTGPAIPAASFDLAESRWSTLRASKTSNSKLRVKTCCLEPFVVAEPLLSREMDQFAKKVLPSDLSRPPSTAGSYEYLTNVTRRFT